ncbi:MAG: class I SAM-dependent methyltransferase [Chloroflexi bacterium]|nr:class I SAM-dependent methyltransferase [Chloroflexota bacterium]
MDGTLSRVRAAYDRDAEREWCRLEAGAQSRLEFLITSYALQRHLPPLDRPCRVLDAGGGPGRYTLLLAGWGYSVTLLDLSPASLDVAKGKIDAAGPDVQDHIEAVMEGSVTELVAFPDRHFDAVLCLGGPLSHLVHPLQRQQAVDELSRVARPGAPVCISVMNRIGAFRSMVQWQLYIDDMDDLQRFWETGISEIGPYRAPAYFFTPDDLVTLLQERGLAVERLYGCNGIGAHLQEEHLVMLMADAARWSAWQEVLLATCDHPNVIGVSRHLLAVARRP